MWGQIQELTLAVVSLTVPQLVAILWSNRGVRREMRSLRRDVRRDRRWSRRAFRRHSARHAAAEQRLDALTPPSAPSP